jgi:parallel beta-helix repeat protein
VNASGLTVDGNGRNGILVIGGAPTILDSEISDSGWSGIVLVDDHSAYVSNNSVHDNTASGIEAAMNSTADIYGNTVSHNRYGIFANRSDPNIEHNVVDENLVGIYLDGAHKDGLAGSSSSTEASFPGSLVGREPDVDYSGDQQIRTTLIAPPIDIFAIGPNETSRLPGETASFLLRVENNQGSQDTATLSIDDDESSWAALNRTSFAISPGDGGNV